jgi:hypothetical protein
MSERASTTTRLAACPFCGSSESLRIVREDKRYFCVVCSIHKNGCGSSSVYDDTEDKVVAAWNRRAAIAAHDAAQPGGEVGELVLMPRALTAENGAKVALMGEFSLSYETVCPECLGAERDDGDECDACSGAGETTYHVDVDWTTIKEIYKRAVELLATPPPASQPAKQGEWDAVAWMARDQSGRKDPNLWFKKPNERDGWELIPLFATHPAQATIKDGAAQAVAGDVVAWRWVGDGLSAGWNNGKPLDTDIALAECKGWTIEYAYPALIAEIASLREDAERYRMARRAADYANEPQCFGPDFWMPSSAAIDAAIRASRGEGV